MRRVEKKARVFLTLGATDMRKQIPRLSLLVEHVSERNPLEGHLYVFSNKRRNTLKVLYLYSNGFYLWQNRLDRDRFKWPKSGKEVQEIRRHEFVWLLEGLDINLHSERPA